MPQLANITVKKNDGVTDIIYTGVVPSSGDKNPAVWKYQAAGVAIGQQPEFRLTARESGDGKRELRSTMFYPQVSTNSTTGVTSVVRKAMGSATWVLDKEMNATDVNEFVSQFANLMASALVKSCVQSGYSAT